MPKLKFVALAVAAALAGGGMYWWYQHGRIYPSTDDAYLQANILTIAPQISGRVAAVGVVENAYVKSGDVLFQIDPDQLRAALETAQANYDLALQTAGVAGSNVSAAEADVTGAQAALVEAQIDFDRRKQLFDAGDVAQAALDQATTTLDQAQAEFERAQAALQASRKQAGSAGTDNATVRAASGQLDQARIDLGYATVTAPADGWIANITLRPGQVVTAGQPLFSLVEDGQWWVDGNYKETDLVRIRPGQPVDVSIDMYPGKSLTGTVDSIGAGSGAVFSLLPPENATGNWVKVTQRFPVRIALHPDSGDSSFQLRVGASVTATVDTSGLDPE